MQPLPGRRYGGAFSVLAEASPMMSPAPPPMLSPHSPKVGYTLPPSLHGSPAANMHSLPGRKLSDCFAESLEGTESTTSGLGMVRQVSSESAYGGLGMVRQASSEMAHPTVMVRQVQASSPYATYTVPQAKTVVASPQGAKKYVVVQGHHSGAAPHVETANVAATHVTAAPHYVRAAGQANHEGRTVYVLASPSSAGQHPHPMTYAAMPSPSGARPAPAPMILSDELPAGHLFTRTISGGMGSPMTVPQSPAWTAVTKPPKQRRSAGSAAAPPLPDFALPDAEAPDAPQQAPVLRSAGEAHDLYYDQKELFQKGFQRSDKQSWSVKAKKKTDYQVDKRRNQSTRDKAAMLGMGADDCEY
mmetsp:Transcript_15392/g.46161  ORF Transcript_15392/g.46161 Transcript_15392/m.46161 type:complete len:359 (-) Transcript_15392:43-1119(-)